jgi:hypothetical protein
MQLQTPGMEFATEMIVNSAQQGLRIAEVATPLAKDGRGRPPHLRSFRDGWRHLRFILSYGPNVLYLAPGGLLLAAGLLLLVMLAAGPIRWGGNYIGIHFLALGSLLTLLGFNVIHLGLLAKLIVRRGRSRMSAWARRLFSLERGLWFGVALVVIGLAVDIRLLLKWLGEPGIDMTDSVHQAFVATTCMVLGVNLVFTSFLTSLLLAEQPRDRGAS